MTTDNPLAFPLAVPRDFQFANNGMTLRDWFAGQFAAAAIVSLKDKAEPKPIARGAYAFADALLAERSKPND